METNELIEKVKQWGRKHKLTDPIMQFAKVNEEVGEIGHELTRGNNDSIEIEDAIGDTLVTVIILSDILGYDPIECLDMAYQTIAKRRGKTINRSFVKESWPYLLVDL